MTTRDDRQAAAALLLLAAAGLVLRLMLGGETAPGEVAYRSHGAGRPARDSLAVRAARLARPLGANERIDLDRAPADELARLPRIGPALAERIVADREAYGAFGTLDGLDRVSGVGPSVLQAIKSHAAFSGLPRPAEPGPSGARDSTPRPLVRLNTATADELTQLPGIGPARAQAIVEDRRRQGSYRRVEDLARIPGIGPATVERLRGSVQFP